MISADNSAGLRDCYIPEAYTKGQFRYSMTLNDKTFSMTCVVERTGEDGYTFAGISDLGVTLLVLRNKGKQIDILVDKLKMPERFLYESIVKDIRLVVDPPNCDKKMAKEDSSGNLWFAAESDDGGDYYYAEGESDRGMIEVEDGKIVYKVRYFFDNDGGLNLLKINNHRSGYQSIIQFSN